MHLLCVSLANMGNFTEALDFGFKALAMSKRMNDSRLVIFSDITLMNCYREEEDYKEAILYGNEAQKLLRQPYADSFQVSVVLAGHRSCCRRGELASCNSPRCICRTRGNQVDRELAGRGTIELPRIRGASRGILRRRDDAALDAPLQARPRPAGAARQDA